MKEFSYTKFIYRISLNDFVIIKKVDSSHDFDKSIIKIRNQLKKIDYLSTPLYISSIYTVKETSENDWIDLTNDLRNKIRLTRIYSKSRITKNSIDVLLATLFEKSSRERSHSERVATLSTILGERLHLGTERLMKLKSAAILHDIGKINIDLSILDKPGPLTKKEYKLVQNHVEIGSRILASVPEYEELSEIVISHHERYDGTGYPFQLKENEIPLESRIISIVDSYDAMTNDRPYRKALSKEEAIEEIIINSGTQFDPELANLFIAYLNES